MKTWCFLGIIFSLPHNKADVYVCAACNRLSLNIEKTNYMIIIIYLHIFISYSMYIGNKQIKYTNNPQFRIAMELAEVQSIQTYIKTQKYP